MGRWLLWFAVSAVLAGLGPAASAADSEAKPERVYALVAAFGNEMSFSQSRYQAGSHIEPYVRAATAISGQALNAAVLKAVDDSLAQQMPSARRVHLALDTSITARLTPDRRDSATLKAVLDTVRRMPERKGWHEIVVITPAYLSPEFNGLPPRISGIGIFVQGIESVELLGLSSGALQGNASSFVQPSQRITVSSSSEEVVTPSGERYPRSTGVYFAVYCYVKVRRYEADTLELISESTSFDSVKMINPDSGDVYFVRTIAPDVLAHRLLTLTYDTTSTTVKRAMGYVVPGPLEMVDKPGDK